MGTPDYTKRAIQKYQASKERIVLLMEQGTKERIKQATGQSVNGYISSLVKADLDRLEHSQETKEQEQPRKPGRIKLSDVGTDYKG